MDGSVSHPGPCSPITASAWLRSPSNGSISAFHVMPTPIELTSTGKKIALRRNPRAMICEDRTAPSSNPRITFAPHVTKA